MYNKKFLKTKIKSHSDEATDFRARKIPNAGSNYIFWSEILIDSVLKKAENYYLLVFSKGCKYIEEKKRHTKKVVKHIADDLKFSSNESDESDEE